MSTEENLFVSNVFQRRDVSLDFPSNKRVIRISHAKMTGTCWGDSSTDVTYHDILTLADHEVIVSVPDFLLLSKRQEYTKKMAETLTKLRVPEFEQPPIIDKVFMAVELADNPQWPIACLIMDITLFHQTISMAYQLDCFEKVRIDSLEGTVRHTQCVICKESLDHFEGVEEGIDRAQLIRLPCSHIFHHDCIFQWLTTSQLCPLCRYSVPVVEQEMPVVEQAMPVVEQAMLVVEETTEMSVVEETTEPSKPSWRQLHWPMLVTATAGGILTAMLVCKLLKQSQV